MQITDSTPDPVGGHFVRDEAGHLTGRVLEAPAIARITSRAPKPDISALSGCIMKQWKDYASAGFTTVTDLAYLPHDGVDQIVKSIASGKNCPIRVGKCYYLQIVIIITCSGIECTPTD